nr:hypothetical protein CFP56_01346 [Quercus suber]
MSRRNGLATTIWAQKVGTGESRRTSWVSRKASAWRQRTTMAEPEDDMLPGVSKLGDAPLQVTVARSCSQEEQCGSAVLQAIRLRRMRASRTTSAISLNLRHFCCAQASKVYSLVFGIGAMPHPSRPASAKLTVTPDLTRSSTAVARHSPERRIPGAVMSSSTVSSLLTRLGCVLASLGVIVWVAVTGPHVRHRHDKAVIFDDRESSTSSYQSCVTPRI